MNPSTKTLVAASIAVTPLLAWPAAADTALTPIEALGKDIFFDDSLSIPNHKQACASCHDAAVGGILPNSAINATTVVAPGAAPHALGNLKPPSNAYASISPPFHSITPPFPGVPPWEGGNFWDGRAEGCGKLSHTPTIRCQVGAQGVTSETIYQADLPTNLQPSYTQYLGPTADQALNPFPNAVEQNTREKAVCQQVKTAKYKALYQQAFGVPIDCTKNLETSYKRIAVALGAYQASSDVNSFSSTRDVAIGKGEHFPLTDFSNVENLGHDLFYNKTSALNPLGHSANCVFCHNGVLNAGGSFSVPPPAGPNATKGEEPGQIYADEGYHNIGVPFNREIPGVAKGEKTGLSNHVTSVADGEFKAPTMRNVAKGAGDPDALIPSKGFTKAYAHNGYFKSLKQIVHFYNTRDALGSRCEAKGIVNATAAEAIANKCWPAAEFEATKVVGIIGKLGLTPDEEDAIVAYLETLTDEHTARAPSAAKKSAR